MVIDMHAHVLPDALPPAPGGLEGWPSLEPRSADGTRLLVNGPMRFPAADTFFEAAARLAAMDANGVDAEVVSPMPPMLNYGLPAGAAAELCQVVNESIVRLCAAAPGRLYGLGSVPLQDPELAAGALADIERLGLHGVEIGSNIGGVSLGSERLLGFFQEAARLGVSIFVHALNPTFADRLPPGLAMAGFGFATEIGLAAASLVTGGTLEKCSDLRLALSHGGGGFPLTLTRAEFFWSGTWNEQPRPAGQEARPGQSAFSPSELARRLYYDALVFDRRALRYLIDMIGPRQLLLGTDFPAMQREQPAYRTLASLQLPAGVFADITWNNCFRWLGLQPPEGD